MVMARSARIRCQPVTPEPGKSCCPNGSIEIRFMSLTLDKVSTPVESALSQCRRKTWSIFDDQCVSFPEPHSPSPEPLVPIQPAQTVYFTKLVLENIRSFSERQELHLTDTDRRPARWTLLVGDNGVGKTTLLQCLARMRPVFSKPPDEDGGSTLQPAPVEPELAGEDDNEVLNALVRSIDNVEGTLEAEFSFGVPFVGSRQRRHGNISTRARITRSGRRLTRFETGGNLQEYQNIEEPLVLAYGAGRHPKSTDVDKAIATRPVESLFKVEAALNDAEELLYRLEFGSLKKNKTATRRLDSLKKMLSAVLPDVSRAQDIEILGPPIASTSVGTTGVRVTTPYGNVPLRWLSLGYQTVFAWTVDIAWRLLERYPNSHNPLLEPAIVLVDEIDLHLHPRWQRDIRNHLTDHFPKVQFIATAHSPLMAQSSLRANLAVLRKLDDHTQVLNDPTVIKEWRLDQVITSDLFGLRSARPPDVEKLLTRRSQLVEKQTHSEMERRELAELDVKIGEFPTAESAMDQNAMDIIRRAAALLEPHSEDL